MTMCRRREQPPHNPHYDRGVVKGLLFLQYISGTEGDAALSGWGLPGVESLSLFVTQSLAFVFAFGHEAAASGKTLLKRLEILHTTIRGVCPSLTAGSPIQLHAATPGSFPTGALLRAAGYSSSWRRAWDRRPLCSVGKRQGSQLRPAYGRQPLAIAGSDTVLFIRVT